MKLEDVWFWIEDNWPWILAVLIVLSIIIGILLIRWQINSRRCYSRAKLHGKTAIITGSNIGIGKEAARDFYRRGARVILACRNIEKANAAARDIETTPTIKGSVIVRHLDLADFSSITAFAKDVLTMESRVDILVNNAGLLTLKQMTVDGFDLTLQANYLGHFLLTNLLLDKIKSSATARIVNVSSDLHKLGKLHWNDLYLNAEGAYGPWKAYCQSKLANILFARELVLQLEGSGVNVYTLHPGVVQTGFQSDSSTAFPGILNVLYNGLKKMFSKTAVQGAQTTIHCAICEKAAQQTGLYYEGCRPTKPHRRARDPAAAKRLWNLSAEMVNLDAELSSLQLKINADANVMSHL